MVDLPYFMFFITKLRFTMLTRAPLGTVGSIPITRPRGATHSPLLFPLDTTGPIFIIQTAIDSPAKVVEGNLISLISGLPMTPQVRSK